MKDFQYWNDMLWLQVGINTAWICAEGVEVYITYTQKKMYKYRYNYTKKIKGRSTGSWRK